MIKMVSYRVAGGTGSAYGNGKVRKEILEKMEKAPLGSVLKVKSGDWVYKYEKIAEGQNEGGIWKGVNTGNLKINGITISKTKIKNAQENEGLFGTISIKERAVK